MPASLQCPVLTLTTLLFVAVAQHWPCAAHRGCLVHSDDSARLSPATCTREVGQ